MPAGEIKCDTPLFLLALPFSLSHTLRRLVGRLPARAILLLAVVDELCITRGRAREVGLNRCSSLCKVIRGQVGSIGFVLLLTDSLELGIEPLE